MAWLFVFSLAFLGYTFVGYPLLLCLLAVFRRRPHERAGIRPTVSLIIPAHNEAQQLAAKIKNTLELRYPDDKREIIIASDGSTDCTLEIARSFSERGVKLVELRESHGKHYVQMLARDISCGEILVFTDASVRLQPEGLREIVSNFADESVGCVSSEDRLVNLGEVGKGEGAYVGFEMWLRRLESQVGSLVGVSGSFFAARREVCDPWHSHQSSDFFIPLHAAARKLRSVVDPRSIGYYSATQKSDTEFHRKVRTIVHGLDVFFCHRGLLNPLTYPLFSWQLISHKLFRWLVPAAALTLFISNIFLWNVGSVYRITFVLQAVLYGGGVLALLLGRESRLFKIIGFFVLGLSATIVAWIMYLSGERFVTWKPTQRT